MMEAKFKIGETLIIVNGPDESKIGKDTECQYRALPDIDEKVHNQFVFNE